MQGGNAYPAILGQSLMDQNLLHSIACCWIVHFGVYADLAGHVNITVWVDVDVADAVCMAQHRDLGVLLDVGHQGVAASGNDQVNDVIQLEQLVNICPGGDETDDISANLRTHRLGGKQGGRTAAGVEVSSHKPLHEEGTIKQHMPSINMFTHACKVLSSFVARSYSSWTWYTPTRVQARLIL